MLCSNCSKLAFFPQSHQCVNCPRFCDYKEYKWCNYCSTVKQICSICGKPIAIKVAPVINTSKDKDQPKHPFYNTGCKGCGGGWVDYKRIRKT